MSAHVCKCSVHPLRLKLFFLFMFTGGSSSCLVKEFEGLDSSLVLKYNLP